MAAVPSCSAAIRCCDGSSRQTSQVESAFDTACLKAEPAGADTAVGPLSSHIKRISQAAGVLSQVASDQHGLHALGELPGDIDLMAMINISEDITRTLRSVQQYKAELRRQPEAMSRERRHDVRSRRRRSIRGPKHCVDCNCTETPEWRSGPKGPSSLCNVCGLLFAKNLQKRHLLDYRKLGRLQAGHGPNPLSLEEDNYYATSPRTSFIEA